jgi:hypothetical protein
MSLSISVLASCLLLADGSRAAAQYGFPPYGYGIGTGRVGPGYQAAGRLYNPAFGQPQTTTNFQPLINAITLVPGWYGTGTHHPHHRIHSHPSGSHVRASQASPSNAGSLHASGSHAPPFDDNGKIVWPSTIPDDPAAAELRQAAEAAVKDAVRDFKTTGHGSVRLVVDAKNKLSAYEDKVLPAVRAKNSTDGAALENFFVDLDNALETMTYVF